MTARRVGVVIAVAGAARAVALFRGPEQPGLLQSPFLWLALAAAMFGAATWRLTTDEPWAPTGAPVPDQWRRRVGVAGLVVGGLAILAYACRLFDQTTIVGAWLLAQVLWVAAFVPRWPGLRRPSRRRLAEVGAVLALLVVAGWLRLWHNADIPLNVHGDVGSHGLEARALLAGAYPDFFGVGFATIPMLAFWPAAISFLVLGDSLGSMNTVSGLEGLVSLVAVYLLVRELWSWRPALFAAALLAGDITHIQYSRHVERMHSEVLVVLSLCLLVYGLRRGRGWQFAAAGLVAGYAVQSYHPGRIVLALAVVVLALTALAAPRLLWARRWGVAAAVVGLLLALGPAMVYYAEHPNALTERASQVFVLSPDGSRHAAAKYGLREGDSAGILLRQFERSTLAFWKYGDTDTHFGIQRSMFDPVVGILLILGLGYAIWRPRSPAMLLLLAWIAAYVAGGTLAGDPPSSERLLGVVAPVAVLGGLVLHRMLGLLPRGRGWAAGAVAIGLLVAAFSGARNWQDYLAWATDPRNCLPRAQIARYLMAQPPDYQVRMVSRDYWWTDREFQFLLPDWKGESVDLAALAKGEVRWPTEPTVFVLSPEARPLAARLQARYPQGRLVDGSLPPLKGVFYAFYTR